MQTEVKAPLWFAAAKGGLAAAMLALPLLLLAISLAFGPAPSGYAGAAFGAAMLLVIAAGQVLAAIAGAVAGAIWLRRPQHGLVKWSVNVLAVLGAGIIALLAFALLAR
ncbi:MULTISPECIES: hypothetical protein [unclassified Duganella]|uniref:hypothetical protein n=1 Tax=unclassified Duganella TaxID=2636909 RepID=UPI0006FA21D2|nr:MULTISPECIES: hypothetical protein [unclassified Duganella]KQV55553.1 hypothetical protein ASD07_27810 [Duganella sp. Root336D2]KRC02618.1 hypothetical protein ASE26_19135 [Duganella sp. Root198D2]